MIPAPNWLTNLIRPSRIVGHCSSPCVQHSALVTFSTYTIHRRRYCPKIRPRGRRQQSTNRKTCAFVTVASQNQVILTCMSARSSGTRGTVIRGGEAGNKTLPKRRKPGRVPTACAECRRLKLRCNRQVPCEKCESRGCAAICPDGVLTPGRGNRLVLANTEELHDKIDNMSSRVRQLERALRDVQSSVTTEPHPLLRSDLVLPSSGHPTPTPPPQPPSISETEPGSSQGQQLSQSPSDPSGPSASSSRRALEQPMTIDEKNDDLEASGTLISTPNGGYLHLGSTARPEYLMRVPSQLRPTLGISRLSKRIINTSFFDSDLQELDDDLGQEMYSFLPQFAEAESLCQVYLEHGTYLYSSLSTTELSETLAHVYRAESNGFTSFEHLSLLFSILALGVMLTPRPDSSRAQEYFYLSRAALSLSPARCGITLVYIQAIIHMAQYLDLSNPVLSHSSSVWLYAGYAARLGQDIALQLNDTQWNLSPEISLRRCRMFWRLFVLDTWTSFYYGRPLVMSSPFIDCPFPKDIPTEHATMSFDLWNSKYASLVHSVITVAFGPKQVPYSSVIDLDRRIRDFHVPTIWMFQNDAESTETTSEVRMQRYFVCARKEIVLLSLHRPYLVKLLSEKPIELERHRYRPSVVACYRSAWRLIRATELTYMHESYRTARLSIFWSHCLSAIIVMSLLVTNDPKGSLAPSALRDLELAVGLFENAAASCPPAYQLLGPVRKLLQTARESASQLSIARVGEEDLDAYPPRELERLAGKTSRHDMTSPHTAWSLNGHSRQRASSNASTWEHLPDIVEEDPFQVLEEIRVRHHGRPPHSPTTGTTSAYRHPTLEQDLSNLERGEFYTNLNSLNDSPSAIPFTTPSSFVASAASTTRDVSQDTMADLSPTQTGSTTYPPLLGDRVLPSEDYVLGMDQYCPNGQQMSSGSGSGTLGGGLLGSNALLMLDPSLQSMAEHLGFFTPLSYSSPWFAPSQLSY